MKIYRLSLLAGLSFLFVFAAAFAANSAEAQQLPRKMPVPAELGSEPPGAKEEAAKAREEVPEDTDTPLRPPVPEPKPDGPAQPRAVPTAVPVPSPSPNAEAPPEKPDQPDTGAATAPTLKPELPSAEELACRTRLTVMGAEFKEGKPSPDRNGCYMPFPIEVSRLTVQIGINAPVTVNCAMAESAGRFLRDVASPAANAEFGSPLKSIAQASGFVCRPRNGTTKLSEHAFGNALDIASFTLGNGTAIAVEPAPPAKNEKYLRAVRNAACGPFKTVLGPGSDADHALHFHFDLAQRRNGGTFCQ